VANAGDAVGDAVGEVAKFNAVLKKTGKIKLESLDSIFKLAKLEEIIDPSLIAINELASAMSDLRELLDEELISQSQFDDMAAGLERAILGAESLGEELQRAGAMAGEVLRSIQSSMSDGSKEYEAMNVAIQAANVVQAIGAILNQAQGDPYTAFGRMAAMAAAVAALGVSIGSFQGGFTDTAAQRQDEQGTGSVLGDAAAKSESILNATEITASATSKLVGINRGMLSALNALTGSIGSATGSIASGGLGDFGKMPDTDLGGFTTGLLSGGLSFMPFIGGIFDGIVNAIFGGKSKITDEGVAILSGTLAELIDGTLIKAFQEIQFKKWVFGSTKTKDELIDLGDDASIQIGLIFEALGDAVREGAIALGIDAALIQERMDAFRVEEMRISLLDLTAEEQAQELQAVFSKIFDDLAAAVVPFIDQFQQVGEGLGETLIRVATSVQVMQEAIAQIGWAVNITDPEKFAQVAVGLVELVGGVDAFISKFTNFVNKFATDEHKFSIATRDLTRAFDAVGLTLPATADGMWELMQSLDATTEQGQRQIATLLELADLADEYYNLRAEALNAEVNALLHIQSIAEGMLAMFANLRDMIIGDQSTPEENYQRARLEAEKLGAALATMTDPDQIDATVKRIDQLLRSAYGLLDADQKQTIGQEFITFIDEVQAMALERLGVSADEALAGTAFTPEEIMALFNEQVTNPLIFVAGLQETAALKLIEAADYLMGRTPADFSIQPGMVAGPVASGGISEVVKNGIEAGMQAGAEAMAEAAASIVTASANSDANSTETAQRVAQAISSMPRRIVIQHTGSEFS